MIMLILVRIAAFGALNQLIKNHGYESTWKYVTMNILSSLGTVIYLTQITILTLSWYEVYTDIQ